MFNMVQFNASLVKLRSMSKFSPVWTFCILEKFGTLLCTWPLHNNNTFFGNAFGKWESVVQEFKWWLLFINVNFLLAAMLLTIYENTNEPLIIIKMYSESFLLLEVNFNMILCKLEKIRLYEILIDISQFMKAASYQEQQVLNKYCRRYVPCLVLVLSAISLAAVAFTADVIRQMFETAQNLELIYPFSTESSFVRTLVCLQHITVIFQVALHTMVDLMVILIIWSIIIRFEVLGLKLSLVTNIKELFTCVQNHQHVIRFAEKSIKEIRFFVYKMLFTVFITGICAALTFVRNEHLAYSIYSSTWVGSSSILTRSLQLVIQRCQQPVKIGVGIFPALSLKFFTAVFYTIASYVVSLNKLLRRSSI